MSKNVQIPKELFMELCKYFLLDGQDQQRTKYIKNALVVKLDTIVRHNLYTQYKTAPTTEQQERARAEYLDMIGMSESFRY